MIGVTVSHHMMSHDRCGKTVHRLCSSCISSVENPTGTIRATGHKTPGESSVNITVSVYDTTHLQENPQRIG